MVPPARGTWWGSFKVAAGYAVDTYRKCEGIYRADVGVTSAAGCVSPNYDFNHVKISHHTYTNPHYTLVNDHLSWSDAKAACRAKGLQLASVHSAAENALLLTAAAGNEVWIGGTDADSEGTWVWSPSGTPLSYTNWGGVEPNNAGNGEDCMELYFGWNAPMHGKWNDVPCTRTLKYVCETPR